MTDYTQTLARLRLSALDALEEALNSTTDPAELRRIAQAIFRAPPPDDAIDSAFEREIEDDAPPQRQSHEPTDPQASEDDDAEPDPPRIAQPRPATTPTPNRALELTVLAAARPTTPPSSGILHPTSRLSPLPP